MGINFGIVFYVVQWQLDTPYIYLAVESILDIQQGISSQRSGLKMRAKDAYTYFEGNYG